MFPAKTALFAILFVGVLGCASTESARYYKLAPIPGSDSASLSESASQGVGIGVGPVKIPDYLDRQTIVTRSDQNKIKIAEFDRWAGSLNDDVPRVLSENLSNLLGTDRVFLYPWRGTVPIDYQIEVEIIQFDGELGKDVLLVARWAIFGGNDRKVLFIKKSSFTESTAAQGYGPMVAAQSRVLGRLSRDIAEAVKGLRKNDMAFMLNKIRRLNHGRDH